MGLFVAPAWLIKGKGVMPAEMMQYSDSELYEGKTHVSCSFLGLTFKRNWSSSSYSISFTVVKNGFTSNPVNLAIETNRDGSGNSGWFYWDMHKKFNFSPGKHFSESLSKTIVGDAKKAIDMTENSKICIVFFTDSEIIEQIDTGSGLNVVGDPKKS